MQKINPFNEQNAIPIEKSYEPYAKIGNYSYDKTTASPYTKTRVILMNGTEFEANWFMHNYSRRCTNNDLRRELALVRRREQQQQKIISALKPLDESILETTISYEQLAVDLTAILAKHATDESVKNALCFALLEDFDHLYRFSNLLRMEQGIDAKDIVKEYTEIMPGRPTISEPRYPTDEIKKWICSNLADPYTRLTVNIITGAEQQTMNYYMNVGNIYPTPLGRRLYSEIAMIEEQHVTQYGSLIDTTSSMLECWLMHEYTECYLYRSCYEDETDEKIKEIWGRLYLEECGHLQHVASLLYKYEGKPWQAVFREGGDFPQLLLFNENIAFVRDVLAKTVNITANGEGYTDVCNLPPSSRFFKYNSTVTKPDTKIASHVVIEKFISKYGMDYRYETDKNPIKELSDRKTDNTTVGRKCK